MVNTRRMDTNGSNPVRVHRTRGSSKNEVEEHEESASSGAQESDDSEDLPLTRPVRQPRKDSEDSEDLPLSSRRPGRPPRKTVDDDIPIRRQYKRRFKARRRSYYSRPMNGDIDSEQEVYHHRSRRARHLAKTSRMLKRSALSLRPISQKSYVDHSPIRFDSDSEEIVRRSKRGRKPNKNLSWLTDSQMHKVGYPNLHAGYSEEDSRDAVDEHDNIEISQRVTRHSNRRVYYEEDRFEDTPEVENARVVTRDFRPRRELRRQINDNHATETRRALRRDQESLSNDKENKEEQHYRTRSSRHGEEEHHHRTRSSRHDENNVKKEQKSDEGESKNEKAQVKEEDAGEKSEDEEQPLQNGLDPAHEDKKAEESSASEEEEQKDPVPRRTRRQSRRILVEEQYPTRNKVLHSSSESEEEVERKKYSLRNRLPKQAPKAMQTRVLRSTNRMDEIRPRRKRRRRRVALSSSSDSTSSDDCRPSAKQTPHSKNEKMKSGAGGSNPIIPIKPETLDASIRFNSIGGLDPHIQCLKEMILLPMMYPEVFRQFQMQPPKGVLFHGPPGTGKTLIARALANECSFGSRKVSFFMRKGADLLSKWIGESEKQLRLLFQQAAKMKPSIIFFDELDGLAPVRSSRQDQVHASIVSTLLALIDGIDDRGDVIVIGATNRIDAIDPALRRPGRFDRELFFPLPSRTEREEILKVQIARWSQPPGPELLSYLAENTVGYCGSDLRGLCSEAVIQSFRRTYPQVYESEHRLLLDPKTVKVQKVDFMRAKSMLVPASQRISQGLGRKLLSILEPILQSSMSRILALIEHQFPHGISINLAKVKLSTNMRPAQILLTGNGPEHGQAIHVAPALLFKMEHIHSYLLDLATLFSEAGRSPEEACIQVFNEARRNIPSIIYIPNIDHWWDLVSDTVKAILVSQLSKIDPNVPFLLLATADNVFSKLDKGIQNLFSYYRKEIFEVRPPGAEARKNFFKGILVDAALRPPRAERERLKTPPPLARAPTPPPAPLTEAQAEKLYETEEHTLRELRIFLRDMCKKLANNKLFYMFTKPVDTDEVPDYTEIIKQPMDLETMMTKVDLHRYECAMDFLIDIDLICANALEYNPARSSADKQIRHRACSLRDYAYTLIKTEMDSDFEGKCQDIRTRRKARKACVSKYLPAYINTPDVREDLLETTTDVNQEEPSASVPDTSKITDNSIPERRSSPIRKRKFSRWQKGYLVKKKKPKLDSSQGSHGGQKPSSKEKLSSDESKENDPDSSTMETPVKLNQKSDNSDNTARQPKNDVTSPLTINCDTSMTDGACRSSKSPKRRLTDLLSPSQLLDSCLYFDDIEQALSESTKDSSEKPVECSPIELDKLLDQTVKATEGFTLSSLLDLYNNFAGIVRKFSKTNVRTTLAKELSKELLRFKKSMSSTETGSNCTSKAAAQ